MKIGEFCTNGCEELMDASVFICGTEYEIEDVTSVLDEDGHGLPFSLTEETQWWGGLGFQRDGSLRNNGIEVVTEPVNFNRALEEFNRVHTYVKVGPEAYTHRTSTHVHVNVQNLTEEQVKTLMLLYALYEPLFFDYVGEERANNIHCVPLAYTYLPTKYNRELSYLVEGWSKYTAFNLLPVRSFGTVEFRHLYGTGSYTVYYKWISLLCRLWYFVYKNEDFNLKTFLLSGGNVNELGQSIFGEQWKTLDYRVNLIDVKLAFV